MLMEMKYKDFTVVETQFANQHLKQWTKATVPRIGLNTGMLKVYYQLFQWSMS